MQRQMQRQTHLAERARNEGECGERKMGLDLDVYCGLRGCVRACVREVDVGSVDGWIGWSVMDGCMVDACIVCS